MRDIFTMIPLISALVAAVLVFISFWFTLLDGGEDFSLLWVSIFVSLIIAFVVWLDVEGRRMNLEDGDDE